MKKLCIFLLAGGILLSSCSKDAPDPGEQTQNLRWSRIDLTGTKYLVLSEGTATKSSSANSDVFKVDENGNMTAIVFYFTYDENGNSQQTRSDVKVIPDKISSYDGGQYMVFRDCQFTDSQGQDLHIQHYGQNPDFLIRKKDGAVFLLSSADLEKFPNNISKYTAKVDSNGDLFICNSSMIYKVEFSGQQTYLRQITPNGIGASQFLLTDQADVLIGTSGMTCNVFNTSGTIYYKNGGFESLRMDSYGYEADKCTYFGNYSFFQDGHQLKMIETRSKYDIVNQISTDTLGIREVNIGSAPPFSIGKEYSHCSIQTWTDNTSQEDRPVDFTYSSAAISCKNHFILIKGLYLLVCNRGDNGTRVFIPNQYPKVTNDGKAFEDKMIDNTLFTLNTATHTIQKYDFETLTYSEVQYDDSSVGPYIQLSTSLGHNSYIINGVRNSDGRSVVIEIDHSTGGVKTTVAPDDRKITELIQLN